MNFLRLHDPLLSVLYSDQDIIAIDKPYGFNAHTNDSKIEHSEFIQDGLIEIYEKNMNQKLHIIHRLDQTTTGVMIFGKSTESAKKYAQYFFDRQVQKTYLFITQSESKQNEFNIDQIIIHKGKELDALTDLKLLKKNSGFEIWRAEPHTGRNHQIRIHAKAAGIPILGDDKYTGSPFPFLCLHNSQIEFPNGIVITSKAPVYFENPELLLMKKNVQMLFESDRRQRLFHFNTKGQCLRLVHHKNKFKNQDLVIDQFGDRQITQPADQAKIQSWTAFDNKLQYELKSDLKNNVGLFTNQRLQRNWVQTNSQNKNVLNLFAYTGAYSICAAAGLANCVTTVDLHKNNLNWCRQNFELNELKTDSHKFLLRDSLTYIEQCAAKSLKFDLILSDTPAFYRREKGVFKIELQLENLIEKCLICLNNAGILLFSTTADDLYIDTIRSVILSIQKKLPLKNIEINCILPSLDFELPDEKANLKSFMIKINDVK
jgi:23S rRNA-/tRNA-specific pseudouridylate synthase/16S rRNA G966 N2-methylase RsmD